jgi:predicted protein tyrosine phosphatase
MIQATRNQLTNLSNRYQTDSKRVLCVCSAGMLRSPTLANVLHKEHGYNTRSCGSSKSWALIPITEALIKWADQIVFVNKDNYLELNQEEKDCIKESGCDVVHLSIEDDYEWNNTELVKALELQYRLVALCETTEGDE